MNELTKILKMADKFCKEGNCGLCSGAINSALNMVAELSTSNQQTQPAKCHRCRGAGVLSSQGADVCCPSCNGRGTQQAGA